MREYVLAPGVEAASVHDDVAEAQLVHVNVVGLSVHEAVMVTDVPTCGEPLLAEREHDGTGFGTVPVPQFTATYATLEPLALLAVTE